MKKRILSPAILVVFLLIATCGFAQDYDLIVTTKGDSIACRIDSITESHIYFEMKSHGHWMHTHINLTGVSHYEKNAIAKGQYLYKPGTTIIKSVYTGEFRRNSVYAGIFTINYSRTLGTPARFTLGGGLVWLDAPGVVLETTVLIGGTRHFFEPGINGFCLVDLSSGEIAEFYDADVIGGCLRMGYRFQGPKGFLFRAAPLICYLNGGIGILPALSVGYSF